MPDITITGITAPFGDIFLGARDCAPTNCATRSGSTADATRSASAASPGASSRASRSAPPPPERSSSRARRLRRRPPVPPDADRRPGDGIAHRLPALSSRSTRPGSSSRTTGRSAQAQRQPRPAIGLLRHGAGARRTALVASSSAQATTSASGSRTRRVGRVDRLYTPRSSTSRRASASPTTRSATADRRPRGLQHGLPAAPRPVDRGRARAPARRDPGRHPASTDIGTQILYGIPVPFNPEFARGSTRRAASSAGPASRRIRTHGLRGESEHQDAVQRELVLQRPAAARAGWVAEVGYVGTAASISNVSTT